MSAPEVVVELDLGLGDGVGEAFGCDLTEEYVRENSEYKAALVGTFPPEWTTAPPTRHAAATISNRRQATL